MKKIFFVVLFLSITIVACTAKHKAISEDKPKLESDTIKIANSDIEYEVIIIDAGFSSWFNTFAKSRNYYSQSYLEARNRVWVQEWNRRAMLPMQYNSMLYEMQIDYQNNINYGYEVNYMLYHYLVYFQLTNKQSLGGFVARL